MFMYVMSTSKGGGIRDKKLTLCVIWSHSASFSFLSFCLMLFSFKSETTVSALKIEKAVFPY